MTVKTQVAQIKAVAMTSTPVTEAWKTGYNDMRRSVKERRNFHNADAPTWPLDQRLAYYNGAMVAAMECGVSLPQEPRISPARLQTIV